MSDLLKSTSVLISLPTLVYVGLAQRKNRLELLSSLKGTTGIKLDNFLSVPYEFLPLAISMVYGIAYKLASSKKDEETDETHSNLPKEALIGAITGLSLSIVGRFGMDLPTKMFGIPRERAYTVHVVAPILYMIIFVYVSYLMKLK